MGPYCLTVGSLGVNLGHNRVLIGLGPSLWTGSPPLHCLDSGVEKNPASFLDKVEYWV